MSNKQARAQQYAQAIMQAMLEQWQSAFDAVSTAMGKDAKLAALLKDPNQGFEAKSKALLASVPASAPGEVKNLLRLMLQDGNLDLVDDVGSALADLASGERAPIKAEITSAAELSDDEKEKVRRKLTADYGEGLVFEFQVDPALLGGLRVRVGDRLIDTSVATRLATLRESLASVVR